MDDRALQEMAAKAAGHELIWRGADAFDVGAINGWACYRRDGKSLFRWIPLTDDGDAHRLQVKLKLGLVPIEDGGWACVTWDHDDEVTLAADFDPKRAIVRAAAAMAPANETGTGEGR